MTKPDISIILCVYNGESFLREALDSIVGQSFINWECILIDDCSEAPAREILAEYAAREERIRLFRNEENRGLQYSLNRALKEARGKYMVRTDADDVCRSDRLEKQFDFMEAHPEISISCCKPFLWKDGKTVPAPISRRGDPDSVRAMFLFFNPICHPGVIARLSEVREFLYHEAFTCSEDLKLWTDMLCAGRRFAVQDEYLLLYRVHGGQVTAATGGAQREQYARIISGMYTKLLFPPSAEETEFQTEGVYFRERADVKRLCRWLKKIRQANKETGNFQRKSVRYACFEILWEYRRAGVSALRLIAPLCGLNPIYAAAELTRMRRRRAQDEKRRAAGAAAFGFKSVPAQVGKGEVFGR